MNKIFKVIWNPATGSYSVASETAKSRGKKSGRSKLLISALVAGGLLSSFGALAQAGLDTGTGVTPAGHNNGTGWIAIGTDAEASTHTTTNGAATAVGYYSKALGMWSTTLGAYSQSNGDASLALGVKAQSNGDRSISMGASSSASINAGYSIAMGVFAFTDAEYAVALGNESKALGKYSLALGNASQASGESSIAFGNTSEASEQNAIALGQGSIASKVNSIALGSNSSSAGENAIALGEGSAAGGSNSLAFGSQSRASGNDSVALGVGATAATDNSVAIGAGSTTDASNTVSVGNSTTKRKIVNMAAGAISNTSTDAINGSQLYTISDSVAKRLGGGATVGNDGSISAVSYALKSGTYNNVGDALSGIDNNTLQWNRTAGAFTAAHGSNTTSKITNVAKGTVSATSTDVVNGSQLYDLQQDALLWNGTAFSAAHGTDVTSKITNVTAGELSDTSTDAVNGSQLKATKDDVAANTTNITNLTGEVAGNTTSITNLTNAVDSLGDDSLLWNKAAGAFSAAHGTDATSKITNVTAGDLTAGSTDAVNGSQLKTTNDNVATNTTNIATNTTNITNLTDTVNNLGEDALKWDDAAGAFTAAHGTNATNKISNVQAGIVSSDSTDAINGSQLYGLADSFTSYLGGGADISDTGVLTGPTYSIGGTDYTNVGDALAAINTSFSDSLGDALLWDTTAGKFSAKHGINNDPSVITDVANGAVSSTSSDAINGSQLYGVSDYIADALGGNAVVNADGSITTPTYAIAGGSYNNVGDALEAIDTTLDDALLWDATANDGAGAFSAGRGVDNTASKITNVANGAISATSSDAINGSQLYTTNKYIADALGGNAEVNADGTITAPTYTIANTDYNNVGEALDALDENALLWDATANNGEGAYNASHDGKASIITNVADGNIGEGSTDAINGSQLFNTNMLIQQNSEVINQLAGNTSETYIEENGAGINYVRTNDTGLTFTDASAQGVGATAVGYNSVASKASSVAIGQDSRSEVETGIALGSSSVSSRLIVKGSRDTSVSEEGVVIGYDTTDGELLGALSIGDDGKYRQIINVADGSEAHDAVTVRQLQNAIGAVATTPTKYYHANSTAEDSLAVGEDSLAMGAKTIVNGNAGIGIGLNTLVLADAINGIAIGSNASANHANSIAMGNGSQTTRGAQTNYTAYNMDAPQNSVGEFSVGSEDGQRQITNVAAGSADTDAVNVSQLKSSEAGGVRYDTKADGSVDYSNITLGGGNGGTTRISNVSAGVNNNDAVNYAQLKQSVQETKQYTDQRMVEMDNKLSKTESKLSGGIASAMAMTGLPQAYTPGASMASIGGGTYNGESAVALGVSMVSANGRWVYKLQGSTNSQGEYSAALGAGIQW
ncbi:YadA-like family protein [Escherichia coli]|uniref:YadA-like family protein n=1 Tax=Escherichia coli TaxID=562 RepID=UPI000BE1FF86|nr:YadA-like family protein [Escherichia coli]HAL6632173.1 adhesin [Escherichia coli]HAM4519855.1 adhesin [Escherichia coli]